MNILCVPIKLDALVADNLISAVSTHDDFSKLPYVDNENRDINPEVAYLASSIDKTPFNSFRSLEKGIHLHWSLPDALTHGEEDDTGLQMPQVPNRWLVMRTHLSDVSLNKSWIVESDYLHPLMSVKPQRAICIPNQKTDDRSYQPFRYLGRQISLSDWQTEDKTELEYLRELNVLGWGSPYFSSLYTDCYSVFGAYDEDVTGEQVDNYHYEVYGWYADPEADYVNKTLLPLDGDFSDNAKNSANWLVVKDADASVQGMMCYGKVSFSQKQDDYQNDGVNPDDSKVCFAKSAYESIAAFLANEACQLGEVSANSVQLENQIQALLFNEAVAGKNIDFIDRLKNARHKEEFDAINGGTVWDYIDESALFDSGEFSQQRKDAIKKDFSAFKKINNKQLEQLNALKTQANNNSHSCQFYSRLLYHDWSKYMLTLHPTNKEGQAYPDVEQIRYLIDAYTMPKLAAHQAKVLALQKKIKTLCDGFIARFNTSVVKQMTGLISDPLLAIPEASYWQPKPPSLLISGSVAQASDRHGFDGELDCQLVAMFEETILDWLINPDNRASLSWQNRALNCWQHQPWSPLFIEWNVHQYADNNASSAVIANQKNYNEDFIVDHYRIPLNDNEFSLPSAAVDLQFDKNSVNFMKETQANVIKGRSLLAFSSKDSIAEKFTDFIEKSAPYENSQVVSDMEKVAGILNESHCLLPSLSGFHDELLMYRDSTLLNIDDAFRFQASAGFPDNVTDRVKACLAGQSFQSLSLGHKFIPIKNGISKLTALHVVDSFGRFKSLDCQQLIQPQNSIEGNAVYSAPRVLQPLRLAFRWQNVVKEENQESSPICGWFCYNPFDENLGFYQRQGSPVGAINSDGEWIDSFGQQQGLAKQLDQDLQALIIKMLSFHCRNRLLKSLFIGNKATLLWDELIAEKILIVEQSNLGIALLRPITAMQWPEYLSYDFDSAQKLFISAQDTTNHLPDLKQAILRSQDNIEPEFNHQVIDASALKPLAIVKASLDLQLMGEAEINKSWSALHYDLKNNQRSNRAFTEVKFPIKLGEYNNLDDGLVAYWLLDKQEKLSSSGYFPQADMSDVTGFIDAASFAQDEHDYIDSQRHEGVDNLSQTLAQRPLSLLMLMDPESRVHATTGIVPKKFLSLEAKLYQQALLNIQPDYFVAPMLTPKSQLSIPLPMQKPWSWQQIKRTDTNDSYTEQAATLKIARQAQYVNFQHNGQKTALTAELVAQRQADWQCLIKLKVLKPLAEDTEQAYYYEIDLTNNEFSGQFQCQVVDIQHCLNASLIPSIVPTDNLSPLDNKVQVVEGWIKELSQPKSD